MSEWRECRLEDLAASDDYALATGPFGSAISSRHFGDSGVPVIRGSNLSLDVGHRLIDDEFVFLPEQKAASFKRSVARRGDLVFTCWGTIGQVGFISSRSRYPAYVVSNKQMKMTPDPKTVDALFLYYLLSGPGMVGNVQGQAIGTSVPGFNLGQLRELRVRLPRLSTQSRIAEILGSIDDLIENNRRRIVLLERIAQVIYREWFVHFRYPGHEHDELVESSLGPIPEGWDARPVSDVASIVRGRSYRKHELVEVGGVPFINLKCMKRGGGFRRDGLKRYAGPFKPEQVARPGDIVLAVTDLTQGREILARATRVPPLDESSGVISLDVVKIAPKDMADHGALFALLLYSDLSERVKEFANGSTVLHLSPDHVAAAHVLWPSEPLRRRLDEVLGTGYETIDALGEVMNRLSNLRDLLLPKLVTGAIDVSQLDLDALLEEPAA